MCCSRRNSLNKGTLLGTPNREPQEYSRNILEYKDPGRYIPIICLLYSWGSRFGVPSRVPLLKVAIIALPYTHWRPREFAAKAPDGRVWILGQRLYGGEDK